MNLSKRLRAGRTLLTGMARIYDHPSIAGVFSDSAEAQGIAADIIDSLPKADDGSVISHNRWAVLSLDAFIEDDRDQHYVVKIDDIDTKNKIVWVTEYDAENDDEHSYTVEEDGDYYFASTHSTKEEADAAAAKAGEETQ